MPHNKHLIFGLGIVFMFLTAFLSKAEEGLWLPQLLESINIKDMKKSGLKLNAKQIYSVNKSSLKDAIVQFGGGCSAEIISNEGLMLTNHHCGYSSISYHTTLEKDYLTNGYWAKNKQEELYVPNLTATIINRIEDVTVKVLKGISDSNSEFKNDSILRANIKTIERAATIGNQYEAFVRPFSYGNEYYLIVAEVFKDVRLVGAPPSDIGKFGGETDNWMWPRYNADFSIFRIYANKDNKPSEYSNTNVPYKPKYVIPISLKGYKEGDFTMVYGFPGRTQEYLSSYAVDMIMNESDPLKVSLREKRLKIMNTDMLKNDTIRLAYTNKYQSVANYYKKWMGEMMGLKKYDALAKKQLFEQEFTEKVKANLIWKDKYNNLLPQLKKVYSEYKQLTREVDFYNECLLTIDAFSYAKNYMTLHSELKKKQKDLPNNFDRTLNDYKKLGFYKGYVKNTDIKICEAMLDHYIKGVPSASRPLVLDSFIQANDNNAKKLTDFLYNNTNFVTKTKTETMLTDFEKFSNLYERDPIYYLVSSVVKHYSSYVFPQYQYDELEINDLQKQYIQAQKELFKDKKFYPDANSTLRVAYGKVEGYHPKDGVYYNHYTSLEGVMEKEIPGDVEFNVPPKLKDLYLKKDYGRYANKDGTMPVCFIASNHTTGGNSGSPVFNGKGQLIGTNFDRNWEGTMSDITYNVNQCRNITLDIRYTLFIIDKFANAGYLIDEMKLKR